MKNIIKNMFLFALLTMIAWSCSKDENKIYYEGGTAPVLEATIVDLVLSDATKTEEAVTLSWSNPNYMFTTGVSSQNVNYVIEIDTLGANFTSSGKQSIAITSDLSKSFTVGEINTILASGLLLKTGMQHNLEVRVKSSLINNSAVLYSNVLQMTATPFMPPPKVAVPMEETLWIVGNATAGGWNNPLADPYIVTQKFTRDPNTYTLYTLTVDFIGGGGYKLVQKMGVWGTQYHALDGGVVSGGDFEMKDSDPQFPGPAEAGTYKVTVDFQLGKYYVEKQ